MRDIKTILTNDCRRICPVFVESGKYTPPSSWINNEDREWNVLFSRDECMNIKLLIGGFMTGYFTDDEIEVMEGIINGVNNMPENTHYGTMLKAVMTNEEILTIYKLFLDRRNNVLYSSIGKEFITMVDSVLRSSVIHQGGE